MEIRNLYLFPMVYFTMSSVDYITLHGTVGMLMKTELEIKCKEI